LERKRRAINVYVSQLSVAAGGELTDKYGLTPSFIRRFMGAYEVVFPIPNRDLVEPTSSGRSGSRFGLWMASVVGTSAKGVTG
jgi:hypothetical protein